MSDEIFEKVVALVLAEAQEKRNSAGWSGSMSDGGAARLEEQVRFFRYGRDRVMPDEWRVFEQQVVRDSDPEYAEYQRLKAKFGNGT